MRRSLTGDTIVAGVAGRPITHSLSPLLHGAWIEALGLDAVYAPFAPVDEVAFDALVAAGRGGALRGLNVTAPFKLQALALADEATETARAAGSANLLLFRDGRVHADSTDGAGLLAALSEQAPDLDLTKGTAVVLGAGGAARAAVAALRSAGAPRVRVLNRTRARVEALATAIGDGVEIADLEEAPGRDVRLVVNALSVRPEVDLCRLIPGAVVMDMTYRPLVTPLLAEAGRLGLTPVDGLAMLIGQARPSFEALFGQAPPPIDVRGMALARMGAAG